MDSDDTDDIDDAPAPQPCAPPQPDAVRDQRFDPMSGTWPMVLLDVVAVAALTTGAFLAVDLAAPAGWRWPTVVAVQFAVLFLGAALPLRYFLVGQQSRANLREALLVEEAQRREFGVRVARGLEMAHDERAAFRVAERAAAELAPDDRVDVLIADSSRAHLGIVASHAPAGSPEGCEVMTPADCPAVRRGHTLHFEDSGATDACPHLSGRDAGGAVCTPVSIMGATVGVVHLAHRLGDPPAATTVDQVEIVAQQLGGRVGLVEAMSKIQRQADTDPLTGLCNRRRLEDDVRDLVRTVTPFALILADLDNFKILNDTHGHEMGDRALRLFARVMLRNVRDGDLVARYGGEEFVLIFPNSTAAAAADAFDRIRLELGVAIADGSVPPFTVSAGVVDTSDSRELQDLVAAADELLLRAKRSGRDRVLSTITPSWPD